MMYLKDLVAAAKMRDAVQAAAITAVTTHGVFMHSNGPEAGYVVRTLHSGKVAYDTSAHDYGKQIPVKVFKSEKLAQKHADKLNDRPQGQPPRGLMAKKATPK